MNKRNLHHFGRNPRILVKNRLRSLRFHRSNPIRTRMRAYAMSEIDKATFREEMEKIKNVFLSNQKNNEIKTTKKIFSALHANGKDSFHFDEDGKLVIPSKKP